MFSLRKECEGRLTSSSFSPESRRMGMVSCSTTSLLLHLLRERNLNGLSQRSTTSIMSGMEVKVFSTITAAT